MMPRATTVLTALCMLSTLSGCALLHDHDEKTAEMQAAESRISSNWQAPLPHDGKVSNLKEWWGQFNDPLLTEMIAAAQAVSPNLASARARLETARASAVAAGAVLLPKLDANISGSKGQADVRFPQGITTSRGLAASWEIDLFGAASAASDVADARLRSAQAEWHLARVSLAADVANDYIAYRACEAQLKQSRVDALSREETARLSVVNRDAGFESAANAALAVASAAQAKGSLAQQKAMCDIQVKALVVLTAIDETELRNKLASMPAGQIPQPAQIAVSEVPASVLAQRPDLYSAAQNVYAAHAEVTQLRAQHLPRISLTGSVGRMRFASDSGVLTGQTWSWGPITLTLPIFDGGVRRANTTAGRARYDEAASQYAAKLRQAIKEVEEAFINLESTATREAEAKTALDGYMISYQGVLTRKNNGLANQFELEDARRSHAAAQTNYINIQRERVGAWIALYRALGGGWETADLNQTTLPIPPNETKQGEQP